MRNIRLIIEYEGTNYHGWQSQINAVAVQDVLKNAIEELTGEDIQLIGSGRTDVGVHAFEQVANFKTNSRIPEDKFSFAINRLLPDDIVIKSSELAENDFHARFSSKGKKYEYLIYNAKHPSALLKNRVWHITSPLDFESMKDAARCFQGEHDFSAFKATGSSVKSSVRTIYASSLIKENDLIRFEIEGNGFLYNMVRIIAGTLAEVGMGRISKDEVDGLIKGLDRRKTGRTAPPQGLYLKGVYY